MKDGGAMGISKVLNIEKNCVISITGAGGKTSLMFNLAKELKELGRVLVTTTTKIYVPKDDQFDFLVDGEREKNLSWEGLKEVNNGIWVYGETINEDGKLTAIDEKKLKDIIGYFDYVLIESDGAKGKRLKGWRWDEPVISRFTTCTMGVLDGQTLHMDINENKVHRLEKFLGSHEGTIEVEDLIEVIFNEKGLFKNSRGKRVLFINKIDDEIVYTGICQLLNEIIHKNRQFNLLNTLIWGSLKTEYFCKIHLGG